MDTTSNYVTFVSILAHAPKALPDWRGQRKGPDGKLTAQSKAAIKQRIHEFSTDGIPAATAKGGVKSLQEPRLANEHRLKALDHGLQGIGLSFAHFKSQYPCGALGTNERRYFLAMDSLPDDLKQVSPDRTRRAAIWDNCTGKGRLEVAWAEPRPLLHDASDMGPSNWSSQYWIYTRQPIRGYMWFDLPHRRHDNTKNAVQRHLKLVKAERTIVNNVWSGPWDGAAHFRCLQEAAEEYFSSHDHNCELFILLYPRIAEQLGGVVSNAPLGSDEHRYAVRQLLPRLPCFSNKGFKAMSNRWYQMQKKIRASAPFDTCLLLIILYVGLTLGWWPSVKDTPLAWRQGSRAAARELVAAVCDAAAVGECPAEPAAHAGNEPRRRRRGSAAPPAKPVETSNHGAENLRGRCKNSMNLVGEILASRYHHIMSVAMAEFTKPLELEHGKGVVMTKTTRGARQLHVQLGSLSRLDSVKGLVEMWVDSEWLHTCGFYDQHGQLPKDLRALPDALASDLFGFFSKLLDDEIMLLRYFHDLPPGRFFRPPGARGCCR